jgi:tRNA 2-selenouridine synthase
MIWVTAPLQERVQRIQRDYIETLAQDYVAEYGQEKGLDQFQAHLTKSLFNLRKRLGLQRYATLDQYLQSALKAQCQSGSFDQHQAWIEPLLTEYYDPMYTYQRQQKTGKLLIEGDINQVIDYLRSHGH